MGKIATKAKLRRPAVLKDSQAPYGNKQKTNAACKTDLGLAYSGTPKTPRRSSNTLRGLDQMTYQEVHSMSQKKALEGWCMSHFQVHELCLLEMQEGHAKEWVCFSMSKSLLLPTTTFDCATSCFHATVRICIEWHRHRLCHASSHMLYCRSQA